MEAAGNKLNGYIISIRTYLHMNFTSCQLKNTIIKIKITLLLVFWSLVWVGITNNDFRTYVSRRDNIFSFLAGFLLKTLNKTPTSRHLYSEYILKSIICTNIFYSGYINTPKVLFIPSDLIQKVRRIFFIYHEIAIFMHRISSSVESPVLTSIYDR